MSLKLKTLRKALPVYAVIQLYDCNNCTYLYEGGPARCPNDWDDWKVHAIYIGYGRENVTMVLKVNIYEKKWIGRFLN